MPRPEGTAVMYPLPRATSTDLAKAAYAAYAEATDNKNVRGEALPAWDDLTTPVQNAWRLAVEAVRHRVEQSQT